MVPPWLTAIFALEQRHRPYNKFLAWELIAHPMVLPSLPAADLLQALDKMVTRSDLGTGWGLGIELAGACRAAGVVEALHRWQDHLTSINPLWPAPG